MPALDPMPAVRPVDGHAATARDAIAVRHGVVPQDGLATRRKPAPKMPKATSGIPRAASTNDSECGDDTRDRSGVAFLLVCARIERRRSGEHAATGLIETSKTAKGRQRDRAHEGARAGRVGNEPAIGRSAPRAMQPSLGREIGHAAALLRLGSRPLVFQGENHAVRARPGPPGRASMVEKVCCR